MKIDKEILQLRIEYLKNAIERKDKEILDKLKSFAKSLSFEKKINTLISERILLKQALHTYLLMAA